MGAFAVGAVDFVGGVPDGDGGGVGPAGAVLAEPAANDPDLGIQSAGAGAGGACVGHPHGDGE